jgi:hypothetical protein
MTDWFTIIVTFIMGFLVGRIYPLIMKFKKFLEKDKTKDDENKNKV